jgi:hypothetical protein
MSNSSILETKWNFSKKTAEEIWANSIWSNEPYFNPPYIVNIHDETISLFKIYKSTIELKWALDFPCEFFEKGISNKRLNFVNCGGFGLKDDKKSTSGILVYKACLKGWGLLIIDAENARVAVVKRLKEVFWIGGW